MHPILKEQGSEEKESKLEPKNAMTENNKPQPTLNNVVQIVNLPHEVLSLNTSLSNRLTEDFTSSDTTSCEGTASRAYKVIVFITSARSKFLAPLFHTFWFTKLHDCFKTHLLQTWRWPKTPNNKFIQYLNLLSEMKSAWERKTNRTIDSQYVLEYQKIYAIF